MKKLFLTGIFLIGFALQTNAFNINDCIEELAMQNINSKNLLTYLKENHLTDKILSVCSENICSNISFSHVEQDIKNFIKQNLAILKNENEEDALEAELKGFKIDKITFHSCDS